MKFIDPLERLLQQERNAERAEMRKMMEMYGTINKDEIRRQKKAVVDAKKPLSYNPFAKLVR